ncbi:radical SAM protein [Geomonas oryzisoli]|uniref:Radical SAM protein n=1 Tax=Geomonas oryzisoli TaxID=2847992 RepID=A0ABX8J1B2_9BACT|nr:radical SAM protein [Geomonas oryzisoli]QWV91953.1 radical SAM protein [Geomonas oryzisoli]
MSQLLPEKITPFLRERLSDLKSSEGPESRAYLGLALQYCKSEEEGAVANEHSLKHYEAGVEVHNEECILPGLERLYRKTLVIEPTLVCLAHCRYCLRSNYAKHTLSEKQLIEVAKYCGHPSNRDILNEVLITGGDPLIFPQRLEVLLNALIEYAPNIKIARIASRIPGQDPARIDQSVQNLFSNKPSLRFELATQINHPVEFFPEVEAAFKRISDCGVKVYSQNVLLKGVNDNIETLVELYNKMRQNNIESHYLFHCIPMVGIHHLRTSVTRGLQLVKELVCSGKISGRAKPMFAAMSDIGKITFYEGVVVEKKDNKILLQSNYRYDERRMWNGSWQLPATAEVDERGYLRVWYDDAC